MWLADPGEREQRNTQRVEQQGPETGNSIEFRPNTMCPYARTMVLSLEVVRIQRWDFIQQTPKRAYPKHEPWCWVWSGAPGRVATPPVQIPTVWV